FSCSDDSGNFDIGEDLVNTKSRVIMTDTFSVKLSTVKLDSISTSGISQLLCGRYSTNLAGTTELVPYFNFDRSSLISSITKFDIFDSITVELGYSGYYIGDTTQVQEFSLYRLTEPLEFINNEIADDELFNNSYFAHEETPAGSFRFLPRISQDSIEFRLDDELGETLIYLALTNDMVLDDDEKFNDYLKGFVLKSSPESKAILGFTGDTAGVKINLYTHLMEEEKVEKEYHFYLATEATHFNQTVSDREGTVFSDLKYQEEELASSVTENVSVTMGSAGLVVRVDFPTMPEIFSFDDRTMFKAQLILRPSTANNIKFLPESLHLYETGRKNQLGDQLITVSTYSSSAVEATLKQDDLNQITECYYIADISEYLLDKLEGNYYNTNNGLLLTIPYTDLQTTADLLILNGEKSATYRPKLNLYFLKYE
ncbi:MAG: DUF4270 family protein, partial [Mangrovibacterium sp.]